MDFPPSFIQTLFVLILSLDYMLITHQNPINSDSIIVQNSTVGLFIGVYKLRLYYNIQNIVMFFKPENASQNLLQNLVQPQLQIETGNSVSFVDEKNLGIALKSCYFSSSIVALVVFIHYEQELVAVIKEVRTEYIIKCCIQY